MSQALISGRIDRNSRMPACVLEVRIWAVLAAWMICAGNVCVQAQTNLTRPEPAADILTNILQARRVASGAEAPPCRVRLEGVVLWVNPARDQLIVQDDSGGITVNVDLRRQLSVQPGQRVRVEGRGRPGHGRLVSDAPLDNDGIHSSAEKSMTLFLSQGLHPICVEWFNGPRNSELSVDWMGPEFLRQRIPDDALFRANEGSLSGTNALTHGLSFSCYEGDWSWLPEFAQLPVSRSGAIGNFDIRVATRETFVGLVFTGYLKVPRAGSYTFWTRSDDGSKLYFDDELLRIHAFGPGKWPAPLRILPGELAREEQECRWAEVEGTVSAETRLSQGGTLELASGMGRTYLNVAKGNDAGVGLLLHSEIKALGIYQTIFTSDGQSASSLLVPDWNDIVIEEMGPAHWADYPVQSIGSLAETNIQHRPKGIVHISGVVSSNASANSFVIEDATGVIPVETAQTIPAPGQSAEVLGRWRREGSNVLVKSGFYREISAEKNTNALLTKVIQIMSLSRSEAQRGYPVKIHGVITALAGLDFFVQDPTWSIYVSRGSAEITDVPRVGDYWEIEGNSNAHFAPDVQLRRGRCLGPGKMPEPIRPTWDELVNGSLATKYLEIQGIATEVKAGDLVLLTREGKVQLLLDDWEPKALKKLEGALVKVRGVGSPARDTNQMILMMTRLRLFNATVAVDEPAPVDPFDMPLKHASDLLVFDPRADALRRIKVAGQVLLDRPGEYFLMDGSNGYRFRPREAVSLHPGDLVEVAGFPDMSGPTPVLLEAAVRVTGTTNLPAATHVSEDGLLNRKLDSTRVSVQARLVGLSTDHADHILELMAGTRSFIARLPNNRDDLSHLLPGSLLELTGVYAGVGGDRASGRDIDSFELLMGSVSNVQVLARPSWWTVRHTMMIVGAMLVVTLGALVWITMLRRQVEERTLQLAAEIRSREQAERHRLLEAERARIAQDLHDDLGATLTEIRFLSAVKSRDSLVPENTRSQLIEVSEKSRQMVSSLDEIVWAVNPANDSLPSLMSYLRHVAEEFFRATDVRCRLDVEQSPPPVSLNSEIRHNLYLVVREALNNVAKHSQATEVWLRIHWRDHTLHILIEDNGCGFTGPDQDATGNGLRNMGQRLEKIGGRFECISRPGSGTACRIHLTFV
jgi:signal transduction histidine kinase